MSWGISELDVQRWGRELERVCEQMAVRFGRVEVPRRAPLSVQGLIAPVDRKNRWPLADDLGGRNAPEHPALYCAFAMKCQRGAR